MTDRALATDTCSRHPFTNCFQNIRGGFGNADKLLGQSEPTAQGYQNAYASWQLGQIEVHVQKEFDTLVAWCGEARSATSDKPQRCHTVTLTFLRSAMTSGLPLRQMTMVPRMSDSKRAISSSISSLSFSAKMTTTPPF